MGFVAPVPSPLSLSPKLLFTQDGLTKQIMEALMLYSSFSTVIGTPAKSAPLPKDLEEEPTLGTLNYYAVVGMLLYLAGHTHPHIFFAVC